MKKKRGTLCLDNSRGYVPVYTLVFLCAAVLVFWTFWREGRTFIYCAARERDGFTQHYTAFAYIGRYIREWAGGLLRGEFALKQFDFNLGYGEDVIGCLGYYGFGDPLMLLSALVPPRWLTGFYQVYILLELWLAGLSFAYFGREKGYPGRWILPASLVYIFSGFAMWAGLCHPEFLSPMLYFPLMLTGLERSLKGQRPVFLAVSTALYALTGYYWLYMGTLFACIYALIRFWEANRGESFLYRWNALWRFFLRSAGGYLLGISAAGIFFLPNVMGFLQSNRVGAGERPALLLSMPEMIQLFLRLTASDSWNFAALAAVALPALAVLMTRRERSFRGMQLMAALLVVFSVTPVSGWLFNAMAYATSRWYVFLDFFVAYFVLMTLEELLTFRWGTVAVCVLAILVYGAAVFAAQPVRRPYAAALGALVITAAVLLALTWARNRRPDRGWERLASLVLTILVTGNVALNGFLAFSHAGAGYLEQFTQGGFVEAETAAMPVRLALDLERESWQRIDQECANPNASMLWNYPGLASYFSTSNGNTARFLTEMELPLHNMVFFPNLDSRSILGALLCNRYWAGEGDRGVPYGYTPVSADVWEDAGCLPLGFTYDTVIQESVWERLNALEKQELMLRAVRTNVSDNSQYEVIDGSTLSTGQVAAGEEADSTLSRVEITGVSGQGADWSGGKLNVWEDGASLTLTFRGLPDSETYLRLDHARLAQSGGTQYTVTVQTEAVNKSHTFSAESFLWHSGQTSTSVNLGYSRDGLNQVTLTFPRSGSFTLDGLEIWCQRMEAYDAWRDKLSWESLSGVEVGTNRFTGVIRVSGARVLCFAIPYSTGWEIRLDGRRATAQRANDFLLAVELTPGEHRVELRYHAPGFRLGLGLSIAGLAGIGLLAWRGRKNRPEKKEEVDG